MTASYIEVESISVHRGAREVLDNINAHFHHGRLHMLLGANGSGKTTLIESILGLIPIVSGKVKIEQTPLSQLTISQRASKMAYVSQQPPQDVNLEVRELLELSAGMRHPWPHRLRAQDTQRIDHILEILKLQDHAKRCVDTLSGGEAKRVWIARALAQGASSLLLDEPLASLDIKQQLDTLQLLKQLRDEGLCIIMSLHDVRLASWADDLMLLKQGSCIAQGPSYCTLTKDHLAQTFDISVQQLSRFLHAEL